jgi:chromate reductase, NAD(P)H dehydrogenase (quinone)
MQILAVSGSLRARSTNTTALRALALLSPPELDIVLYEELEQIPLFNPDTEEVSENSAVARFRAALQRSKAVLFSTPEYAHGVSGVLKNALDWVVGSGELSGKLVVMVNASSRGIYAQASLREILKTMDACLPANLEITIELLGKDLTATEIVNDPAYKDVIEDFLRRLVDYLKAATH